MIKDFKDKVAVVTGAGSGIGRSLAHAFAKKGMKIIIADINEITLNIVSHELEKLGAEVLHLVIDVSDRNQVTQLANAAFERFSKVNILCNNAGVGHGGLMQLLTLEDWDYCLGVNLFGVIYGVKAFLQHMIDNKEPCHIVNTASVAGLLTSESSYSVSKFGVVAVSEMLALQNFNSNVGISVLCPGFVDTNIMKNSEILREKHSGLFQPTEEMVEAGKTNAENFGTLLKLGMSPDTVAEMVIEAIREGIFYIIPHPQYLPILQNRLDGIRADSLRLKKKFAIEESESKKTYEHISPNFSISYLDNWIEIKPPPNTSEVFKATDIGQSLDVFVSDMPPNMLLEDTIKNLVEILGTYFGTEIKIISEKQVMLKDDTTPAYIGEIEYKLGGLIMCKVLQVSVMKENKVVSVIVGANSNIFNEEHVKIINSLEFKL